MVWRELGKLSSKAKALLMAASGNSSSSENLGDVSEDEVLQGLSAYGSYSTSLQDIDFSRLNLENSEDIRAILQSSNKISILIVGKTGTGKSSLVNGLVGKQVADEGIGLSTSGTTQHVSAYHTMVRDVKITIFDSPGLQDGSGMEDTYLDEMKRKCGDIDLMIFALRITESKFVRNNPDAVAMGKITTTFGPSVWKKTIVVLTCADAVEAMNPNMRDMNHTDKVWFFRKLVNDFSSAIQDTLINDLHVPEDIVCELKTVPTGHSSVSRLVDGTLWFSNFWMECLTVIETPEARAAMLRLNVSRFRSAENVKESDFLRRLEDQPIVLVRKKSDMKKMAMTVGGIAGSGFVGALVGCIGLLGGPFGIVGIPVGFYMGIVIGALLSAMREKGKN